MKDLEDAVKIGGVVVYSTGEGEFATNRGIVIAINSFDADAIDSLELLTEGGLVVVDRKDVVAVMDDKDNCAHHNHGRRDRKHRLDLLEYVEEIHPNKLTTRNAYNKFPDIENYALTRIILHAAMRGDLCRESGVYGFHLTQQGLETARELRESLYGKPEEEQQEDG